MMLSFVFSPFGAGFHLRCFCWLGCKWGATVSGAFNRDGSFGAVACRSHHLRQKLSESRSACQCSYTGHSSFNLVNTFAH